MIIKSNKSHVSREKYVVPNRNKPQAQTSSILGAKKQKELHGSQNSNPDH